MANVVYGGATIRTKSGLRQPRGVRIDGFLNEEDAIELYKRWKPEWPAPVEHRGNVKVISCEAVFEVGYEALKKVYGIKRAKAYMAVAERNKAS